MLPSTRLAIQSVPSAFGDRQLWSESKRQTSPGRTHARPYALSPAPPTATWPTALHALERAIQRPSSRYALFLHRWQRPAKTSNRKQRAPCSETLHTKNDDSSCCSTRNVKCSSCYSTRNVKCGDKFKHARYTRAKCTVNQEQLSSPLTCDTHSTIGAFSCRGRCAAAIAGR